MTASFQAWVTRWIGSLIDIEKSAGVIDLKRDICLVLNMLGLWCWLNI